MFRSLQVEQDLGFFSDLGADPVMFMEMVSRIEDEFGKRVSRRSRISMTIYYRRQGGYVFLLCVFAGLFVCLS